MRNSLYTRILSGIAAAVMTITNITPLTPMSAKEDYYEKPAKASLTETAAVTSDPTEVPTADTEEFCHPTKCTMTETAAFCGPTEFTEETTEPFCGPTEFTEETTEPFCGPMQVNPFSGENTAEEPTVWAEEDLSQQSIELYPNGEEAEQVVSLEGLMPEGATAEAVDVSDEHDGVAAYDITITAGEEEYQPGEEHPILVEITDPVIADAESIELWHIKDDGTREQICDFTVEEAKIRFYATGFSVYEIVDDVMQQHDEIALFDYIYQHGFEGFDVSYVASTKSDAAASSPTRGGPFYLHNKIIGAPNNRKGIESSIVDNDSSAAKLYFDPVGSENNKYYIYFKDSQNNKQYLSMKIDATNYGNNKRAAINYADTDNPKTIFTLEKHPSNNRFRIGASIGDNTYLWIRNGNTPNAITPVVGYMKENDQGDAGSVWMTIKMSVGEDPYALNGKTYGLMHYVSGATGNALMATDDKNALEIISRVVRKEGSAQSDLLYVAQDADITEWTFEWAEEDKYYIYAKYGETKKYLNLGKVNEGDDANKVSAIETSTPQKIQVKPDNKGRILLTVDEKSVDFLANNENQNESGRFVTSATGSYLYFVNHTELEDDEIITYKAKEVSVSEVENGEQVVIYTRIWDDNAKKYNFYAIDHDGTLIPCYERGNSIMWLSSKINTMIWDFTEYYYEYTTTPNYYYELYNPYSEKYIAPKRSNNCVLSDDPIGINLEGRRYGEYYTTILAWDQESYSYSGIKTDLVSERIAVSPRAKADTFYFARVVDIKNELTEVETVDNTQYGITMKMVKFPIPAGNNYKPDGSTTTSKEQHAVMGNSTYNPTSQTLGLLTTNLTDGKFPTATLSGKSLSELYTNSENLQSSNVVNHLFIQSIYEQSGYFEYDSCQNFATLKNNHQSENEDGKKLYLVVENGKEVVKPYAATQTPPPGAEPIYDFFVSKELGTHDGKTSNSLKHGQFFPYDDIDMDQYATQNELNKYDATLKELSPDDPRKYERLHLIESADYYFGMELDAGFTQTPNGQDNWGHDIIFEFTGDDDFWLYVDGELVIDLGGIHSALPGNVNFATGDVVVNGNKTNLRDVFAANYQKRGKDPNQIIEELKKHFDYNKSITNPKITDFKTVFKDYTNHTMKIFYMERGAGASNLHMRFNLNYVKEGNVTMTKEVTGSDDMDFDFVEYPVQIWYCSNIPGTDNPDPNTKTLLNPNDEHVKVAYQNSTRPVIFKSSYTPAGATEAYQNVFFINAEQKLEIHFPDEATHYKIVECGINTQVYDGVYINGEPINASAELGTDGIRKSFSSEWAQVKERTSLMLTNHVDPNGLRSLVFQKKLYDADYRSTMGDDEKKLHKITAEQDPTTFAFRLYLSNGTIDELALANMFKYRVMDPEGYYCSWNMTLGKLEKSDPTGEEDYLNEALELLDSLKNKITEDEKNTFIHHLESSHNTDSLNEALADIKNIRRIKNNTSGTPDPESPLTKEQQAVIKEALLYPITFETSINGQISSIPAWYTVEVPNLPAGVIFKVEERDSASERPLGYNRVEYERDGDSYLTIAGNVENVGIIRASESPYMHVINKRGYEIEAKKNWTDKDFASSHDDIYVALFVKKADGTYELANSAPHPVRLLKSPETQVRFFMESLDGKALSDYSIFEVTLTGTPAVDANGYVTGYTDISKIPDGEFANINATDRITDETKLYKYAVTYESGGTVNPLNSIQAKKSWSDADIESKTQIYTALCYKLENGTYTLADSSLSPVRSLIAPNDTVRYFIPQLAEGTTADSYKIFEIPVASLTDPAITVDPSGYVEWYSDVVSIVNSDSATLLPSTFEIYTARSDSITNTRQGGIVIDLYRMGTRNMANNIIDVSQGETAGVPLPGGVFKLEVETVVTDSEGHQVIDQQTNKPKKKRTLIGNFTSDADGKITIMYNFERNEDISNYENGTCYVLTQISSPVTYIGLPEPVTFAIGKGEEPEIVVTGNEAKWNNYHKLPGTTEEVVAYIDVYNKPFTLKAVKVDSEDDTVLEGVHFALFKAVSSVDGLVPSDQPISGYNDLVTNSNGEIPRITQGLEKGTYFLREITPKPGYKLYERYIRFVIGENDIELVASVITQTTTENNTTVTTITSNTGIKLIKTDSNSYACVLMIPNEKDESSFYFNIQKNILGDKYIHSSDPTQKFVFKVERFAEDAVFSAATPPAVEETFYVTLSCNEPFTDEDALELDPYTDTDSGVGYAWDNTISTVTITYNGSDSYTYPAAVLKGTAKVKLTQKGIYRVTELTRASSTDYEFWKDSQKYIPKKGSSSTGTTGATASGDPYVYFSISAEDSDSISPAAVSFTNAETQYAYLSAQDYAQNTIKPKPASS